MKIGLSLSRCVRDIVEDRVDINDVLLLITRTDFDPHVEDQWQNIWEGYNTLNPEWRGLDYSTVTVVVSQLWDSGRIHQPRKFGAHPRRLPYHWLETVVSDTDLERSPVIKDAWDKFKMISGLKGTPLKAHNE
jgi:hypothetical protein